jgi:molybdopterin molybdotransferase
MGGMACGTGTDLVSVAEVDALLAGLRRPFGTGISRLAEAAGRILAEPLRADRDGPPFPRATMDGYALRYADWAAGRRRFHVGGQQWPGSPALELPAQAGACVEIMTGAPCPVGADCVVPYEETSVSQDIVSIAEGVKIIPGQCVHPRGSDFRAGQELVPAGTRLGPAEIGIAASCGYAEMRTALWPDICLVSTGDELVNVRETPAPGQIRQSNIHALGAALRLAGAQGLVPSHLGDEREAVRSTLEVLTQLPVVIITGGISKGRKDWVAPVLNEWAPPLFHGVSQRPGKPMGVWALEKSVVFALPGNPVSALTGLHRFVLPWLRANAGLTNLPPARNLTLAADITAPRGLTWFLPVRVDAEGLAHPAPTNTSGDYAALHHSDGFLETPAAADHLKAGERFPFTPWL